MNPVPPAPAPPPATPPPQGRVAWPRVAELALAFLFGALTLALLQYAWRRLGDGGRPTVPLEVAYHRPDLNQADRDALAQLPGVGPTLAARIADHRDAHGPFRSVEDLDGVKGIGPKTVERLKPRVQVQGSPADGGKDMAGPAPKKGAPARPVNVNRATKEDLQGLPGIGPTLAERIVAERTEHGPYRQVADLKRVKGIKDKTLEKLVPYVCVADEEATR
jgi:competence ComEA-like helix-hairpin-helix protein